MASRTSDSAVGVTQPSKLAVQTHPVQTHYQLPTASTSQKTLVSVPHTARSAKPPSLSLRASTSQIRLSRNNLPAAVSSAKDELKRRLSKSAAPSERGGRHRSTPSVPAIPPLPSIASNKQIRRTQSTLSLQSPRARTTAAANFAPTAKPELKRKPSKPTGFADSVAKVPTQAHQRNAHSVSVAPPKPFVISTQKNPATGVKVPDGTDLLQVAAQVYAWSYIQSILQDEISSAHKSAQESFRGSSRKLASEESHVVDQRVRYGAERLLAFFEELSMAEAESHLANTVQTFLSHEQDWARIEREVMALVERNSITSSNAERLLERLDDEALRIVKITVDLKVNSIAPGSERLVPVLSQLQPVLDARAQNIALARELINACSRDNLN